MGWAAWIAGVLPRLRQRIVLSQLTAGKRQSEGVPMGTLYLALNNGI
jgi:hypothetical protein